MQTDQLNAPANMSGHLFCFVQQLRQHGFELYADEIKSAHIIMTGGFITTKPLLRNALRCTFCKSSIQWQKFPLLFEQYWRPIREESILEPDKYVENERRTTTTGLSYFSESHAKNITLETTEDTVTLYSGGASDAQTFGLRDFRFVFNPKDMRRIEKIVDDISRRMQKRLTRRARQHQRRGQLDLRRTTRQSLKHSGWPFELMHRKKQKAPTRIVLLLDVSQSMEIYSYLFLRFARGLSQAFKHTDAFAFHTELIPIGDELRDKSTQRLERRLKDLSSGWLGGTRISTSLKRFNKEFARQTLNKNTVVLVFSDGCDSGNPDELLSEVLKVKSQCRNLVWVNPLLGRGIVNDPPLPIEESFNAVIPHLDLYTTAHNLSSLKKLEKAFKLR